MKFDNIHIKTLVDNLRALNPYLIILFGSYANGEPDEESDLDIFIVLNDTKTPQSFKEKQDLYMKVSPYIRTISRSIPVDLLVFTIPMYETLKKSNSQFADEILTKGIVLYENTHKAMA
jgi:predicted nucleotidyltransferase